MAGFLSKLKERLSPSSGVLDEAEEEGYVELGTGDAEERSKIVVRPYVLQDFEHIKPILDSLRAGHTIALINIKPLKDKDLVELKRAINKIKKTCDAIDGDIAGFGEDWIAAVPSFAHIHRHHEKPTQEKAKNVPEVTEYSEDREFE
ncbi:MAG: cell division protein SepF [Nanoarchaeota archaeon]